jgi:hypothetical protein
MSLASGFSGLDWSRPWLAPFQAHAAEVSQALAQGQPVADLLNGLAARQAAAACAVPGVRFVPQASLPEGQAYESFIWRERQVPTRDNLHDLFNGLAWLTWPRTKARLNELQAAQIEAAGVGAVRGVVRDALTLFDENAALLLGPPELLQALKARQWQRLFVQLRPLWAGAQLILLGHAAQEKLQAPRKAITAHVYLPQGPIDAADVDGGLAADLQAAHLAQKPYTPLPILGIPGWWSSNENFSFYDDPRVFRPLLAEGLAGA